ncbi:MAG: hypothetical protein Q8Q95_04450 [bacterium]|nr:hypothetical protein [bacterium]
MSKLTWRAFEFEQPERHPNWFVSLWILALALVVVAIILKSYLMAVFVIISAALINIYAVKEPNEYSFSLDTENLTIGEKTHKLIDFKSFWIFERADGNVLSLEGKNIMNSHLEVPLAEINPDIVKDILSPVVTEKEHNESITDILARLLKF